MRVDEKYRGLVNAEMVPIEMNGLRLEEGQIDTCVDNSLQQCTEEEIISHHGI